ncbi:F0F1 ATP synthase subunit delta [Buchnera aphidicola]|uniref:F0F1 ATP synthase subunit delta n=1 Tax=Buchnera aphidicola TaxID=9 RepID=UPI003464C314
MLVSQTIARPYARAIFELAIENNSIEKWKSMLILMNQIASHEKIRYYLSGSVAPQYLVSFFLLIGQKKIDQYGRNFIQLLSNNKRLNILHEILKKFLILESVYKNIVNVELISSHHLKKYQINNINNILKQFVTGRINFTSKIDTSIIGGIIIKIRNTVFNLSINNHLKQLSNFLKFEENNNICN